MVKIVKNTLLKYIPANFEIEKLVNTHRIYDFNNNAIQKGSIIYLCEREIRLKDNFALMFAYSKSKELNLPLKVIHPKIIYQYEPKQKFIDRQIENTKAMFLESGLNFNIVWKPDLKDCALLIIDFNPILDRSFLKYANFKIFEVDGHNIIPAKYISDKQEYNAASLRRKIYYNIYPFFTEFENIIDTKSEAEEVLEDFVKEKLPYYAEFKNNPVKNVLSGLSKYLNLGFISSQRVALEVIKSKASDIDKEAFLEELIVRKELADNFCFYCKNFKSFQCVPKWAQQSLNAHRNDFRTGIYSRSQFENSQTDDKLWNAAQNQLKKDGVIHGYLRMYWAKKISEWSLAPEKALETAIYLNDKYAYDSPSSNGYVGILWSIAGLHDRAFQDWFITGKIRRMTYGAIKRKFDIEKYIEIYKSK